MKTAYLKVVVEDEPYDFGRKIKCHYPCSPVMSFEANMGDIKDMTVALDVPIDVLHDLRECLPTDGHTMINDKLLKACRKILGCV